MKSYLVTALIFSSASAPAMASLPPELPRMALVQPQMSSGLPGDLRLIVELIDYSPERLARLRAQLKSGVELRRADGAAIALKASLDSEDPPHLIIQPGRMLVSGYYDLRMRAPDLRAAYPSGRLQRQSDGAIGLRVHVGSRPEVQRVELCPSPSSKRERLRIVYSEPVRLARSALLSDAVLWSREDGSPLVCNDAAESVLEMVTSRLSLGDATPVWELECDPLEGDGYLSVSAAVQGTGETPAAALGKGAGFDAQLFKKELRREGECLVLTP